MLVAGCWLLDGGIAGGQCGGAEGDLQAVQDELLVEAKYGGADAAVGIRGMGMTFKVARMGGKR
jgi:hypothetical protein